MVETVLGWTDLQIKAITALGQLALAGTVAYIAFQQWRTARNKLKLDLFDRRFAACEELRNIVTSFRTRQTMAEADAILALAPTFQYLFGSEVSQHVLQMGGNAMRIAQIRGDRTLSSHETESSVCACLERFDARHLAVLQRTGPALRLQH
ncbi:TPA: hypothetical protein ACKQDF_000775 [Stenotrophomonas maltophilia]